MNSSYTNKRVYEVAGVTRQAIHQFCSRRADYEQRVEEAEAMLILHRKGHGGLGLVKAYGQIKPGGLGRDRFVYEMTRRGYALPRPRNYSRTTRSDGYRYPNLTKQPPTGSRWVGTSTEVVATWP